MKANKIGLEDLAKVAAHLSYRSSVIRAMSFGDKIKEKESARSDGEKIISSFLVQCLENTPISANEVSDCWSLLYELYHKKYGFNNYTYGNAQKWVNMSIKYYIILLSQYGYEYKALTKIPVFPVDGIMIKIIKKELGIEFEGCWSKCDSKETFIKFIQKVDSKIGETLFKYEITHWAP